ncbi:universal stress protein [Marinobacter daepoensis]|uniref:universal stress protein n=1 Tax=Marinobacter daepoensis TaxID=262077 RepID=UPI001C9499CB|nr:universal stress protein [Marinobacter daepoensis]MBY6031995.1 universal stress protein [Marinobacter daepoensis]
MTEMTRKPEGTPPGPVPERRILVLLDGSRLSLETLETVADLARASNARVLGIFVEEVNLLRSAGYRFAREVGRSSGITRPLDVESLHRRLDAMAVNIRRAFEQMMAPHGVVGSLTTCQGKVAEQVLTLAQPADLLVLGRAGWSGGSGARLGSTARALVHQAPGDVLLCPAFTGGVAGRVVVLLNHDQGANHRAVRVGAELAHRNRSPLTVLVRADGEDDRRLLTDLTAFLGQEGIAATVKCLTGAGAIAMARAVKVEGAGQLVVSRGSRLFSERGAAEALLCALNIPVTVTP